MNKLLFRTVHGSHLYGLAHAASDTDWYEVWDELPGGRKAMQTISCGDDVVRVALDEFLAQLGKGVPQAVEALYAPDSAVRDDNIRWLRSSLVLGTAATVNRYRSTAKSHLLINPSAKRRRHAARLAHDLHDFLALGRIRPAAFSRTEYADIGMYQESMPELPAAWQH